MTSVDKHAKLGAVQKWRRKGQRQRQKKENPSYPLTGDKIQRNFPRIPPSLLPTARGGCTSRRGSNNTHRCSRNNTLLLSFSLFLLLFHPSLLLLRFSRPFAVALPFRILSSPLPASRYWSLLLLFLLRLLLLLLLLSRCLAVFLRLCRRSGPSGGGG